MSNHPIYCPACRMPYDEVDYIYKVCHHCGYNAEIRQYEQTGKRQAGPREANKVQREILRILFAGGHVGPYGNRYRAWDRYKNPLKRFSVATFRNLKRFCREN